MMTSDAISAKGIRAQMPHPILTRVFGEPTHKQVKMVIHKLSTNLMAIFCPWGHSKGHLRQMLPYEITQYLYLNFNTTCKGRQKCLSFPPRGRATALGQCDIRFVGQPCPLRDAFRPDQIRIGIYLLFSNGGNTLFW
jgi:hypothetical protein